MRFISPISGLSIQDIYKMLSQRSGMFPIGANNFWHGGIHIETDKPVVAIADGKVIAYRVTQNYLSIKLKGDVFDYSNNFVLLEHAYISPLGKPLKFYSLYMHLLPQDLYNINLKKPQYLSRTPFVVTAADIPPAGVTGSAGLYVYNSTSSAVVIRTIPQNETVYLRILNEIWAMVVDAKQPSIDTSEFVVYGGKVCEQASEPFVEQYDSVTASKISLNAGEVIGYPGLYMTKKGQPPRPMIHFEIFTDDSLQLMIKNQTAEGDDIVHIQMAKTLKKGKPAYSSNPPKALELRSGSDVHSVNLKISTNSTVKILGDPDIDSDYIECAIIEMTRIVPLNFLTIPLQGDNYGLSQTSILGLTEIFDCFPLNVATDHLSFRWLCSLDGVRVDPPATSQLGLFTFRVPVNRQQSVWIKKTALGDLRYKEKRISAEITDVYSVDPEAFCFDDTIEGLSIEEYFLDKKSVRKKLDKNNAIWYEITTPYLGDNKATILKFLLEDFGIKWTPKETGWIRADSCREVKASRWPGFKIIEESGGNKDGFCDFQNLSGEALDIFKEIDTSKDGIIDEKELEKAVKQQDICYKLMRCICKIPSEWQADCALTKWDRLKTFFKNADDLAAIQNQIRQLIWWDDVSRLVNGFPSSSIVCHVHPLAFIAHMAKLPYCVRQLQRNLITLGFRFIHEADGVINGDTMVALREFLISTRMNRIARIRSNAPLLLQRGADIATQQGEISGLSAYCASLESVPNNMLYCGPGGPVVNNEVIKLMHYWIDNKWRNPIILEAWQVQNSTGNRLSIFKNGHRFCVNICEYNEIQTSTISEIPGRRVRIFVRDFTMHYNLNPMHINDPMFVVGRFTSFGAWGGPVNLPTREVWAECEIVPQNLIGQANPQGATLSSFKVIRAVSEVECVGFFDCITAYDNAFISSGPCHWTLGLANANNANGRVSEGELCAYLAYFAFTEPQAYKHAFGQFGLAIAEKWDDGRGNGVTLVDTGRQRKYTGWIAQEDHNGVFHRISNNVDDWHYYHSWIWFYRFQMAARTIERYRRKMWDMARMRLRDILRSSWNANGPWGTAMTNVTIGDVFTSERAVAMIQRWHVRFPSHVISNNNAGQHLRNALNRAMNYPVAPETLPIQWNSAPTQWGNAHELLLIQGILDEVQSTNNTEFINTINNVNNWPSWNTPGQNNYNYQLIVQQRLSTLRDSFQLDIAGLPMVPNN